MRHDSDLWHGLEIIAKIGNPLAGSCGLLLLDDSLQSFEIWILILSLIPG